MKKLTQAAGLAGLLFITLGIMVRLVSQRWSALVEVHFALGTVCLLLGVFTNLGEIKETMFKRSMRMGPQTLAQAVLLLVVLVLGYLVVLKKDVMKDFTRQDLFTLSRTTKEVAGNLAGPVDVIAFFPSDKLREARLRLELYKAEFPKIASLRFVDPDKNEEIAREEGALAQACVLFKYKESSDKINRVFITRYEESDITNALIKVTRETNPKVWFTTGHGEAELDQDDINGLTHLREMLREQGYAPETVDLSTLDTIPDDVSMVAAVGPTGLVPDSEAIKVDDYLGRGGNLLLLLDPVLEVKTFTGLERLTEDYGVNVNFDLVFEPRARLAGDKLGTWMVITDFPPHEITDSMSSARGVFYLSRSLSANGKTAKTTSAFPLAQTSSASYQRVVNAQYVATIQDEEEFNKYMRGFLETPQQPEEASGPFVLAYAVTKTYGPDRWRRRLGEDQEKREARLVIAGTSTICRNKAITMPNNYEFVMNCMNWLAGEKDLKIIAAPSRGGSRINLDQRQKDMILYVSVMIIPELFMVIGVAVWWRRR